MVFGFLKKPPEAQIGLDISSEGIIAVLLNKDKKGFSIKFLAREFFQEEVIQNGLIINSDEFSRVLSKIVSEHQSNTNLVNIAVPSSITFIKTITLPDLPYQEIKIIVSQEAAKHIPFPTDEANIDFEILEDTKRIENNVKKVDIILVAIAKSIVDNYIENVSNAGLEVAAVDIAPFSMIRTLAHTNLIDESDSLYISVLVGYENTDINIIHKGFPLFSNNVPIGKKNIIDSLCTALEVDVNKVKEILPDIALVIPGMDINPDPLLNKAAATVRTIYNNISGEIQKTIEFYNSQNVHEKEIKRIILGGSGICVQNTDKYITNRLKIDTFLCNSLNNIEYSDNLIHQVNVPALTTSIGLALKGLKN